MGLRTAALYGRDPATLRTTAEMLALRGVHPHPREAAAALEAVRDAPPPDKPDRRRPLRVWVRSVSALLIFGGFMSPPSHEDEAARGRAPQAQGRRAAWRIGGGDLADHLGLPDHLHDRHGLGLREPHPPARPRVLLFYDGEADDARDAIKAAKERKRQGPQAPSQHSDRALRLSIALPLGFIGVADYYRQRTGVNWIGALGGLVALSLVIATAVVASRR